MAEVQKSSEFQKEHNYYKDGVKRVTLPIVRPSETPSSHRVIPIVAWCVDIYHSVHVSTACTLHQGNNIGITSLV